MIKSNKDNSTFYDREFILNNSCIKITNYDYDSNNIFSDELENNYNNVLSILKKILDKKQIKWSDFKDELNKVNIYFSEFKKELFVIEKNVVKDLSLNYGSKIYISFLDISKKIDTSNGNKFYENIFKSYNDSDFENDLIKIRNSILHHDNLNDKQIEWIVNYIKKKCLANII